jgi:hypothetical protein
MAAAGRKDEPMNWRFGLAISAAAILAVLHVPPAPASAETVFPPGSRIGLEPAAGFTVAKGFPGFEDTGRQAKVMLAELPPAAFAALEAAAQAKAGKGAKARRPEPIQTPAGRGFFSREPAEGANGARRWALIAEAAGFTAYVLIEIPQDRTNAFPENEIRKMLASVSTRTEVPVDEQLAQLPFRLSERGGFKHVRTLVPGSTIVLTDGEERAPVEETTYVVIAVSPGAPTQTEDRKRFAEQLVTSIPGLRNVRVISSEPMRVNGSPAFETRLEAVSGRAETEVALVQWVRFGPGAYLRIVAGTPKSRWNEEFTRFRAVRDGIQSP